jgi:CheY-like chemotaxis protein
MRQDLDVIRQMTERGAGLTRRLLSFSRKQVLRPTVFALDELISDIVPMVKRLIGEDVEIATDLARGAGHVRADRGEVEQVLVNLIVNARAAMPQGGKIRVSTAVEPPWAVLAVRDTGTGMTDEVKARVFEPFFTTKDPGKGTGLGLATVHGIITQHGGEITVESAPGAGSTFTLRLPLVDAEPGGAAVPEAIAAGEGTILLVEDEQDVLIVTQRLLQEHGYEVITFGTPQAAIAFLSNGGGPVDLLMTDVVMPEMNGRELTVTLRRLQPDLKVLYCSGYSAEVLAEHGVMPEEVHFLGKPFGKAVLLRAVSQALQPGSARRDWC